ncbi:MAG: VanZ family protein [Bacillota bacterium]
MQRYRQYRRVLLLWLPVLLQAALIFFFSAQPAGSPVLNRFPFTGVIGHGAGYALLALLLYRALTGGLRRWSTRLAACAFSMALLYGVSDELHQAFVPGRQLSGLDLLVDGAGAAATLVAVRVGIAVRDRRNTPAESEAGSEPGRL